MRDANYVWCQGQVKVIFESANREACLGIQFINLPQNPDEIIMRTSPRLASFGSFSLRPDLPTYYQDRNGQALVSINRPPEISAKLKLFEEAQTESQDSSTLGRLFGYFQQERLDKTLN